MIRRRSLSVLLGLLLTALTVATYWPIRQNGFIDFDDHEYIVDNPVVADGVSWRSVRWALTTRHTGNFHPVTWLSHLIDGELFGVDRPAGHHLHNLLLHTASALVLFGLLVRMTGAVGRSFFAACVFAVHPLQVESISWAAERKAVLAMLFWMLTLLAYVRYVERRTVLRYLAVAVFFALALASKQTVVTLPFVLLLLDYWPLGRVDVPARGRGGDRRPTESTSPDLTCSQAPAWQRALPTQPRSLNQLIWEKVPLLAMTAAVCLLTLWVQAQAGLVKAGTTRPLTARLENAAVSYVVYLRKMLWPSDLAVFYPHPGDTLPAWKVAGSVAVLLALTGIALATRKRRPYLAVGWFWYVGTLVPLIGLVQAGLHAMTDRHSYIPLVGLEIAIAWLVADAAEAWRARPLMLGAAGTAVVLVLAALSWRQTRLWRDSITLFEHTINVTDENDVARYNLALVLEREGRRAEAIRRYEEAVAINPDYVSARLNLGAALAQEAKFDEAVEQLEALLRQKPDDEMAHHNLANVLVELGRDEEAADHYRRAIAMRPDWPQPLIGLTWVLASSPAERLRDGREAVLLAERARDLIRRGGPAEIGQLAGCLDALAAAYAEAGRYPEAIRTAEEAADVAIATNNAGSAREIQRTRLRRYRERQPFRQPVKGTGARASPG